MDNNMIMMHASARLLEQARRMIGASQFQNAEMVLDALIRVDPENVEAWKAYLWVRQNQTGLDWVKDRALKTQELSDAGKREILNFYFYLVEQMRNDKNLHVHSDDSTHGQCQCAEDECAAEDSAVRFELLNTFDYSTCSIRKDARLKPRRVTYNFAVDIAGGLVREISRHPFGQKIVAYIRKAGDLVNELAGDPGQAYARLIESPHFEKVSGFATLALVFLGARLVAADHWFGYVVLGVSVILGKWWLSKFQLPGIAAFNDQVRTYLQESEDNLPEIIVDAEDQERKRI